MKRRYLGQKLRMCPKHKQTVPVVYFLSTSITKVKANMLWVCDLRTDGRTDEHSEL